MIEKVIKRYFDGHLDVPSFFEHQSKMPETFVMIEKTGGNQTNLLKSSVIAFQSYAPSLLKAAELNEKVKDVVAGLVTQNEVYGVRLNSDYNFTDTESKKYRYQAVFDINHY